MKWMKLYYLPLILTLLCSGCMTTSADTSSDTPNPMTTITPQQSNYPDVYHRIPASENLPLLQEKTLASPQRDHQSNLLTVGDDGKGQYHPWSDQGDRIPDFSKSGYRQGSVAIPDDIPTVVSVSPDGEGDATARIQAAIDAVSKMPLQANGYRGAVLLKQGVYVCDGDLWIRHSGVVLRGEGNHKGGTVLISTKQEGGEKSVFLHVGERCYLKPRNKGTEITSTYVPVGETRMQVADSSVLKVGDEVVLIKRVNDKWLEDTQHKGLPGWTPQKYSYHYQRKITAIDGNTVTLDVPVVDAVNAEYGGGKIFPYKWFQRIENCGVEDILFVSDYDPNIIRRGKDLNSDFDYLNIKHFEYPCDENHAWIAVEFEGIQHGWARNLRSYYFAYSLVRIGSTASHITVRDSQCLDPVSIIRGGRRYSFCVYGQKNLVERCLTRNDRHAFVVQFRVPGPNVFRNCRALNTYNYCEPHLCWSTGILYDNVTVEGAFGILSSTWRGFLGNGAHGWAGANTFFWNCKATLVYSHSPPTAKNFVIGFTPIESEHKPNIIRSMERVFQSPSGQKVLHNGTGLMGDAYGESLDRPVFPASLYQFQQGR